MSTGFVIWFTGLSGSGKSTLTRLVSAELRRRGVHVEALDGDDVRKMLSKGLGFSRDDRDANIRRIGYVARMIARSGACGIAAAISPYRDVRDEVRRATEQFCEVYCECPIEVLAERDPKGLYKRALAGEIKHFTGVDDPYEAPADPEVRCRTDIEPPETSAQKIISKLEELGYIPELGAAARTDESTLTPPHGAELVDRRLVGAALAAARERAGELPVVGLDATAERDVVAIGTGAFSPLTGFMTRNDYLKVVGSGRLENGLPWPLPVTLALTPDLAETVEKSSEIALTDSSGAVVALLEVTDFWEIDRALEKESIYDKPGPNAPGLKRLEGPATHYVGGEIALLQLPKSFSGNATIAEPAANRKLLIDHGWRSTVALPMLGPMLRGDEFRARTALETCDGLFLQTVMAPELPFSLAALERWHSHLAQTYFRAERVICGSIPLAPRGVPALDALLSALVAKNFGASHIVVPHDPNAGPTGVRPIFDYYSPGELRIIPLCYEDVFHSPSLGTMASAKTAPDPIAARLSTPRSELIAGLGRGETGPPELIRPETLARLTG